MGSGVSKAKKPSGGPGREDLAERERLAEVLKASGITKVVMIRHANAKPRDPEAAAVEAGTVLKADTPFANAWTVGDLTRELTDKGREQAAAAKTWLGSHKVRATIASEAARAIQTKEIMTAGIEKGEMTLHTLHPSRSGTPECEKMFDKLGCTSRASNTLPARPSVSPSHATVTGVTDGTLNTYYQDSSVEGCEGRGKPIFRHYMTKVTSELHDLIKAGAASFPAHGDTVAVFGHAVFLNAVAVAVAEAFGIENADETVAQLELGEAQGILCDGGAKTITLCAAPA